jgi:hypothetical protein
MYLEYYFNSEIFTDLVKAGGNRNRRLLELNEPLNLHAFQVKTIELPLSWDNVTENHVFDVSILYATGNVLFTKQVTLLKGFYTSETFAETLQDLLRNTPWITPAALAPDSAFFNVSVDDNDGRLQFSFLSAGHNATRTGAATLTVTFPASMRSYVSVPFHDQWSQVYTGTVPDIDAAVDADLKATSDFALRLVPNYLYLHSNLMAHTHHGSATRAIGGYTSRTIMAKVPLNTADYTWGTEILIWDNPSLDKDFMFRCGANQHITRMEFWFTDEAGKEIDFNNVSFSLTLSCLA